jgi:glycerol-3-phosphate dehydrogenase (NAD(P)+)
MIGKKKKKIMVIGAGAWGTAIANLLAKNGSEVFLFSNKKEITKEINLKRTNQKFLPDIKLSNKIFATTDLKLSINFCDIIFIATPSSKIELILEEFIDLKINQQVGFVLCSKGLNHADLKFFSEIFSQNFSKNKIAILSGPNFALEVASLVPTVTSIASKDKEFAAKIIKLLNNSHFSAQYFSSPMTAEVCGLMKNVIAIGCGMIDELNLGVNAKAALVVRGISEIQKLCKKLNISDEISTPAGFGDIFLTCCSEKSRNNSFGRMIVQGKTYQQIKLNKTFEGVDSAFSIVKLAKKKKIKLSLSEVIVDIISSKHSRKMIKEKIIQTILQHE